MRTRTRIALTLGLLIAAMGAASQEASFTRTILQQSDISIAGREAVTAVASIQAGGVAPRHTHAGEEVGYVLEGSIILEQDGKPPVTLDAGKAFIIPSGVIHGARNAGLRTARILATYIVEKGKPLATPAP